MSTLEIILLIAFVLFVAINLVFNTRLQRNYKMVVGRAKIIGRHLLQVEAERDQLRKEIERLNHINAALTKEVQKYQNQ